MMKKITTPQKNRSMYSSQKHLIEEDTSTDENVVIVSGKNSKSYVNTACDTEQIPMKILKSPEPKKNPIESSDLDVEEIIDVGNNPKKKRIKRKKVEKPVKDEHESSDTTNSNKPLSNIDEKRIGSGKSVRSKKSNKSVKVEETKTSEDETDTDHMKLIGVHVINSDMLANHLFLHGPYVKIYIINSKTGCVMNTFDDKNKYNYSTKPFEFYKKGTIVPQWDEIILLDRELTERLTSLSDIIVFFTIFDQKIISDEKNTDECVCWAFIKLLGKNSTYNVNKKLKLQLYQSEIEILDSKNESVYEWWKNKPWKPYPSLLYAIVKGVKKDIPDETVNEIKFTISQNSLKSNVVNLKKIENPTLGNKDDVMKRSKGEQCKIPNKIMSTVQIDDGSSTMLKFSKCGNYLASSAKSDIKYVIVIYKIPECEELTRLLHHRGLVYDIGWNFAGNKIISASADCTVCVWDITDPLNHSKQKLIHPAFVYSAKFCNCNEDIIATGSYDKIVRIWSAKSKSGHDVKSYRLSEELEGHTGFVNAICFSECNEMFFSADSHGNIFKWMNGKNGWIKIMYSDVKIDEFHSKIINDVVLFPGGCKLLIVLRNHSPWALDIATSTILTCYKDGVLDKYQTRGCITPCGTFILSGNNAWIASSGELYANYNPIIFDNHTIMSTDYHPFYNIIAFASGNEHTPILLCHHKQSGYRDASLGLELYSTSLLLHPGTMDDKYTEKHFKSAVKRVQNVVTDKNGKNKEFKLWNLLRKMDGILSNARKGQINRQYRLSDDEKPQVYIVDEKQLKNGKSESDGNITISVDLTDFHKKMQNNRKEIDIESNNSGTYTLENEKHPTVKNKNVSKNEIEESSTLSNAESLEDDSNTYIISLDK